MKQKKKIDFGLLRSYPAAFAMGIAVPIISAIGFWIMFHAGAWWIPLFISYLALILSPTGYILQKKQRDQQHFLIGDEAFYQLYPAERKRALKRLRKAGVPEQIAQTVEAYRSKRPALSAETLELSDRARRIGTGLFRMSGVLLTALACYVGSWSFDGARGLGEQAFLLFSAGALLAVAILAFCNRQLRLVNTAVTIVLFAGIWTRLVLVLTKGVPFWSSRFLESVACLAAFVLLAYVVNAFADRMMAEAGQAESKRDLDLELFELGAIDEAQLRLRLE